MQCYFVSLIASTLRICAFMKPIKTKPWKPLSPARYRAQADQLVTHSIKGVNTNAAGGGVRVVSQWDREMPYACVRFGREQVALDYTSGATSSDPTEQIDAIRLDDCLRYSGIDENDRRFIQHEILPLLAAPFIDAGSHVSPRVRQILVEDGQGADLCLTPLSSGGFSARLHRLTESALESIALDQDNGSALRAFFDEAVIKVGGDKAQNAGRIHLVWAMQKAYRPGVPDQDPGLREAMGLHYRGVYTIPPIPLLEDYARFLDTLRTRDHRKDLPLQRTEPRMQEEAHHMQRLVSAILKRGDEARAKIRPHVESGVLETIASMELPLAQQGLLDPDLRTSAWREALARYLAQAIASAKLPDGQWIVGISGRSAVSLEPLILEALP